MFFYPYIAEPVTFQEAVREDPEIRLAQILDLIK